MVYIYLSSARFIHLTAYVYKIRLYFSIIILYSCYLYSTAYKFNLTYNFYILEKKEKKCSQWKRKKEMFTENLISSKKKNNKYSAKGMHVRTYSLCISFQANNMFFFFCFTSWFCHVRQKSYTAFHLVQYTAPARTSYLSSHSFRFDSSRFVVYFCCLFPLNVLSIVWNTIIRFR